MKILGFQNIRIAGNIIGLASPKVDMGRYKAVFRSTTVSRSPSDIVQEDHSKVTGESWPLPNDACSPLPSRASCDVRIIALEDSKATISDDKQVPNFKPVLLRFWFLSLMFLVLMAMISMLVFATYALPDGTKQVDPDTVIKAQETPGGYMNQTNRMDTVKLGWRLRMEQHGKKESLKRPREDFVKVQPVVPKNARNGSSSDGLVYKGTSNTEAPGNKDTSFTWPDSMEENIPQGASRAPRRIPGLRLGVAPGWRLRPGAGNTTSLSKQDLYPSDVSEDGGRTCYYTMKENLKTWDFSAHNLSRLLTPSPSGLPQTISSVDLMTPLTRSPIQSLSPSFVNSSSTTEPCDFTITVTEALVARTPGRPEDFISSNDNIVTQTPVPTPVSPSTPSTPNRNVSHTETCFFQTITVTNWGVLTVATVTTTKEITIQTPDKRATKELVPRLIEEPTRLGVRPCPQGTVSTVTLSLAMPITVTATVNRTITKYDSWSGVSRTGRLPSPSSGGREAIIQPSPSRTGTANPEFTPTSQGKPHVMPTGERSLVVRTTTNSRGKTGLVTCSNRLIKPPDLTPMLTVLKTTSIDLRGKSNLTTSVLVFASPTQETLVNSQGCPTEIKQYYIQNFPHATILPGSRVDSSITASYYLVTSTTTLSDAEGKPTATSTVVQTKVVSLITLTDNQGEPTRTVSTLANTTFPITPSATPTERPNDNSTTLLVYKITNFEYFAGLFLPTLTATILAIPFRILDSVVKLYHPFYILASTRHGSPAKESIYWKTSGPWNILQSFRFLWRGQALLAISGTLVVVSVALVPLSVEAIRITLQGEECRVGQGNARNCAIALGIFLVPTYILIGLLAAMGILLIAFVILLQRQRTGVYSDPWTLSEMTRMSSHPSMQLLFRYFLQRKDQANSRNVISSLHSKLYALRHWQDGNSTRYGVVLIDQGDVLSMKHTEGSDAKNPRSQKRGDGKKEVSFYILTIWGRLLLLAVIVGLLAIILIYNLLVSKLDAFFSSETVTVRGFITLVGMIVTMSWSSFFHCKLIEIVIVRSTLVNIINTNKK